MKCVSQLGNVVQLIRAFGDGTGSMGMPNDDQDQKLVITRIKASFAAVAAVSMPTTT